MGKRWDVKIWMSISPGEDRDWAAPSKVSREQYLLHSSTEDVIALVIGNLD